MISSKGKAETKDTKSHNLVFSVFTFIKNYWATFALICINLLIFIAMIFSGVKFSKPIDLINWGGICDICITENEWWRLISACFIHFDFFHLVVNCLTLASAGYLIESYLKKWKFLLIFLICGIVANTAGFYWNKNVLYAGADGAVFGICGILLAMYLVNILNFKINLKSVVSILIAVTINILYDFADEVPETLHIFGFIIGISLGLILFLPKKLYNF